MSAEDTNLPAAPSAVAELMHEMRNELTIAKATVEAFVDGKLPPTQQRLEAVLQALIELEAMIGDLPSGAPSVESRMRPSEINVCELLDREYQSLEAIARAKGVAISVRRCLRPAQACTHFYADPVRIGEIVKNLLLNAVQVTPSGGHIDIDCSRRADQLEIRIHDSGPGVRPDESKKIFEAGFRGSAAAAGSAGSGYGLALVRRFIEAHGGTVTLSQGGDHGAVFIVRLPGSVQALSPACGACESSFA
ncbi:MAG: hypothetical protein DLM53_11625 [Candidatus Eremiobacter antarcticus]|nr:HAMP domain-containing histidine kinase [Candidatus Eremiobacteraeota bacterium]MBC5809013.1 HAMP domain-containing histidine kinase [Candidatus Eremiobacteraeota bacterium]PZR60313.1 MAG: hypothetical protein DLM53_11625 [Candidatus Eremiobacter sp. RRmetagenome_bin22]